jgi:hypothetical protein
MEWDMGASSFDGSVDDIDISGGLGTVIHTPYAY